jgi:hypothetical protein
MKITISDSKDLTKLFENTIFPQLNAANPFLEMYIDCPEATRYTNMFLNSNVNARINFTPPSVDSVTYAGLFSMCKDLSYQPFIDTSKCINMAAMFKGCENMRFSVHFLDTKNVRDMRQMFWGCTNFSGNGVQGFDFSSLNSPNAMRNFMGGGCSMRQAYYDQFIENLYNQMIVGTLPKPMYEVEMGESQYSPYYSSMRQELIDYGWNILDGGQAVPTIEPSRWEQEFYDSIYSRLVNNPDNWLDGVDMSCHTKSAMGGILISPRYMIFAYHYMPSVGQKIVFWNGQQAIVEHRDAGLVNYGDLVLVRLKEPVEGVNPVLFLNKDWKKQCPRLASYGPPSPFLPMENTPTIWIDNGNRVCVSTVSYITEYPRMPNRVVMVEPENPVFKSKYKGAVPGDSGSPQCFLYNDKFVFSHPITAGGPGTGTWINLKAVRDFIDMKLAVYGEKVQILGEDYE